MNLMYAKYKLFLNCLREKFRERVHENQNVECWFYIVYMGSNSLFFP